MDRSSSRLIVFLSTIILSMPVISSAGVLPIGQPEYEFIYDLQERVWTLAPDSASHQVLPLRLKRMQSNLGPFEFLRSQDNDHLSFVPLGSMFLHARKDSRSDSFELLRGTINGQPRDNLQVYASFVLDEELARDPDYTGKKWRGLAGRAEQAFVNFTTGGLDLVCGRFASAWGPRRSLVFSNHQYLDGLAYSYRWGRLTLSYRMAQLDGLSPEADRVLEFENRFLAAHRLDVRLSQRLTVGVFETVLFGGPGRQLDIFYLNPFIFFHGTQLNEDVNDNTNVGFDFDFLPVDRLRLYGQVLVDDMQIEQKTQGDQEPNQFAALGGVYWAEAIPSLDVQLEYTQVRNWTFNQTLVRNRYLNDGDPIGQIQGNDYDLIELQVIRWWRQFLNSSITLSHYRQGEGRIEAEWTSPWLAVEGDYSEPFPTGTVEKSTRVALGAKGFVSDYGFFDGEAGVDWIKNRNNESGDDVNRPFFRLRLTAFLPRSINID